MNKNKRKVGLTELVLRDGQQSLIATRMRLDDMLEVAKKMDQVGYWSVEMWGGATYDSCLRYLNEDPWHRLRELKKIFKKTKLQMLIRGKNLVGYKPYSDEIIKAFVEKLADLNGPSDNDMALEQGRTLFGEKNYNEALDYFTLAANKNLPEA